MRDLKVLADEEANSLRELALTAWDYALSGEFRGVNPRQFGDEVDRGDPKLLLKMERGLGVKLLLDIYHFRMTIPDQEDPFAEGTFASMRGKRLHIADIKMLNPERPRDDSEFVDQTHESLRLFTAFLSNATAVAREVNAERITLNAANRSLFEAFERHGFGLARTNSARAAYEFGIGIPMTLAV